MTRERSNHELRADVGEPKLFSGTKECIDHEKHRNLPSHVGITAGSIYEKHGNADHQGQNYKCPTIECPPDCILLERSQEHIAV